MLKLQAYGLEAFFIWLFSCSPGYFLLKYIDNIKGSAVKYLIAIVLLSFSFNTYASKKSKSSFEKVHKKTWSKHLVKETAKMACDNKNSFYRDCYKVSKSYCSSTIKRVMQACYNKQKKKIPTKIWPETEGENYARAIGACAGIKYHTQFKKKYKEGKSCPKL